MVETRYSTVNFVAAFKKTGDLRYLQYPIDQTLRQCRTIQSSDVNRGYDVIEGILTSGFVRDALLALGQLSDSGFPAINCWATCAVRFAADQRSAPGPRS